MPQPARPAPPRIAIAGAGLPSLALALALTRALGPALAVTLHDPEADRRRDRRAFALSPAALRMLDALGLGQAVRAAAEPLLTMTITDSRPADPVRPDYLGFGGDRAEPLGHVIEADVLARLLEEACRAAGVEARREAVLGFEKGGDAIRVGSAEAGAPAALLVAADGARSRLRELAGIGWVGRRYGQAAIVGTVAHERDGGGRAVQHFLPGGPFAILPLRRGEGPLPHRSSIVWTDDAGTAEAVVRSSPDEVLEAVQGRFGRSFGRLALEGPLASHPLAIGLARRFVAPRFALLGDAAHEIHPLAGQGLNLGLADAAALAERVVDAVRLGLDPGGADVLAGYERDRRADAVAMAAATDGLNRLFSNDSLVARFARDLGLGLVDRTPGLKGFFVREASGLTGRAPRLMRGEAL